ncbi:hypothetical protein ABG768_021351, partial [Culter alburnus]
MEEDEELEKMMLSLSPTKYLTQPMFLPVLKRRHKPPAILSKPDRPNEYSAIASPRPVRVPLPVLPKLLDLSTSKTTSPLRPVQETVFCQSLIPVTSAQSAASTPPSGPPAAAGQSFSGLSAASTGYPSAQLEEKPAVPPLPSYEQDVNRWHCKKYWFADKPQWMDMLPSRFCNILPAFLTHKKAICKTVMDELRRTGKSPNDMANQLSEALHLRYERAHLAYLSTVKNVLDGDSGLYGQQTITGALRATNTPAPFGEYGDVVGWCGVTVSAHYLVDCLIQEYHRQESTLNLLLQGTFGQALRADHTRKVARKVVLASGIGLDDISHAIVTHISSVKPLVSELRLWEHCRTRVPHPKELLQRVESVLQRFFLECDPDGVPLFKPSMLKVWRIQRVHILRGCLSDPEVRRGSSIGMARWVTGTQVSTELFEAQGMIGVARWNFQRLVDLKQPGVKLPAVFDPVLIMELNKLSDMVTGQAKYPALLVSQTDTRERFGLQYVEPGCRPVPLDWDKHKSQRVPVAGEGEHQSSEPSALSERFPPDDPPEEVREEHFAH